MPRLLEITVEMPDTEDEDTVFAYFAELYDVFEKIVLLSKFGFDTPELTMCVGDGAGGWSA